MFTLVLIEASVKQAIAVRVARGEVHCELFRRRKHSDLREYLVLVLQNSITYSPAKLRGDTHPQLLNTSVAESALERMHACV